MTPRSALPLAAVVGLLAWGTRPEPAGPDELWRPERPLPPPPVDLRGPAGPVGAEDLAGHWTVVVLGWLRCPDVCPAALSGLSRSLDLLGDDVEVWFVSVDPAHDADGLGAAVGWYDARIRPLTGEPPALEALASGLELSFAARGDGFVHATSAAVLDPAGRVVGHALQPSVPLSVARALAALRRDHVAPAELAIPDAPPTAPARVAYGRVDVAVTGARSPAFREVSLHETSAGPGGAGMAPIPGLAAGDVLAPGGRHLMLVGPLRPLGDAVAIELTTPDGPVWVRAPVVHR